MGDPITRRYGDDPVLTRETRRAVVSVVAAVVLLVLGLSLVVTAVGLKLGPWGLFRAVGATHGWLLLLPVAIAALWVTRELARPVRTRSVAHGRSEEISVDHPQRVALARMAALADMPVPTLWIVPSPQPNSYVVVEPDGTQVLCVTTGALELCSQAELDAMLAHELFHVAHGDARLIAKLESVAELADRRTAFLAGRIVPAVRRLMRQRELAADRAAALLTGRPGDIDSAVRTCVRAGVEAGPPDLRRALAVPFVEAAVGAAGQPPARRTHPTVDERAESLARVAAQLGRR